MGQVKSAVKSTICGAQLAARRESDVISDKSDVNGAPFSSPPARPQISVTRGSITRVGPLLQTVPETDDILVIGDIQPVRLPSADHKMAPTRRKSRLFQGAASFSRNRVEFSHLSSDPMTLPPPSRSQMRRESFLYRSDANLDTSPAKLATRPGTSTVSEQSSVEGASDIVTPFAQILASLKTVRASLATLVAASKKPETTSQRLSADDVTTHANASSSVFEAHKVRETLSELDWCLEQLETMQTHRSIGDMATSKFRRLLSKELMQLSESNKATGMQISEYIVNTFLDKEQDVDLPVLSRAVSTVTVSQASVTTVPTFSIALERLVASDKVGSGTGDTVTSGKVDSVTGDTVDSDKAPPTDVTDLQAPPTDDEDDAFLHVTFNFALNSDGHKCLSKTHLQTWGVDIFEIAQLTNNRPLTALAFTVFQRRHLLETFKIAPEVMVNFLSRVEDNYHSDVPYHNSIHAADVVQSIHVLLSLTALDKVFSDLEILAVIFACAIHDVDHPGVSNQYLINSGSELAVLYNDLSVLENHHLAVAFKLLQHDGCDILASLTVKQRQTLRKLTIDMVLATDMSKHMRLLADLKTMVETKNVAGSGFLLLDNYSDRIQVLESMVHCADLSNPAKPLPVYRQWVQRISEEFYRQGDLEKKAGLPVSAMCDRNSTNLEKSQVGFIDYVAHPLWETWADLVQPECQYILDIMETNRQWYHDQSLAPQSDLNTSDSKPAIDTGKS